MKQKISEALWGCLEIPLCMKAGAARFVNSKEAMLWSFLVPALLLPLVIFIAPINPDLAALSPLVLAFKYTLNVFISAILYFGTVYLIAGALHRREYFFQFVNASNWLNLSALIISLPFYALVAGDIYSFDEMKNLLIFLLIYGFIYYAFMLTYVFRINWMLAASVSILGMAIGQLSHFLVYQVSF